MTNKKKTLLILGVVLILLLLLFAVAIFTNRIPMNEDNLAGNTAGNLNNGGLFCEIGERVYFANAYDGNSLYSMNPDETDMKKLGVNSVSLINAGGKYLYYYMESGTNEGNSGKGLGYMGRTAGIYRSKQNGKSTVCLDRTYVTLMQLCGNYIYYQDNGTKKDPSLCKVKIDNSEHVTVADYIINPVSYVNGNIYFNGTQEDHYLYALDTRTDKAATIWQGNIWNPVYMDNYVYYMDVANNYRLCRYSLSDDRIEVLTDDRIDFFNIYDYYIYYQKSSQTDPALKRMYLDGSNPEIIAEGTYENINITSEYVYFNQYGASVPVYKVDTYGGTSVTTFDAARDAAMENLKE
ncbi:MAG: DUF5050 domain-containing protein [Blautia sp.]|nr:DUF5050 domain-containing protein [Lachnoclostridium sp.]MCM1210272.1 DUF5050 domain-containing protein [Blautia sp.]